MTKPLYRYRGFNGPDVSLKTSLTEYGIIWKQIKKDEFKFIYLIIYAPSRFDYGFMTKKEFLSLCSEDWFDLPAVLNFAGSNKADFLSHFPSSIVSAIQYHGVENIFGTSYTEGFEIKGIK